MSSAYGQILIFLAVALALSLTLGQTSALLGRKRPSPAKLEPYESGIVPEQRLGARFSVQYYLIAMLFVVFDVEAISFYPWAVTLRTLRVTGLWEMLAFLIVLGLGYLFVWRKGGLEWSK